MHRNLCTGGKLNEASDFGADLGGTGLSGGRCELTYENEHPNVVVLVEGTMVKGWDYMRGMPPGGTLVINTHYTPDYMIRFVPGPERLAQLVCAELKPDRRGKSAWLLERPSGGRARRGQ